MNKVLTAPGFFNKPENWLRWKSAQGRQDIVIENAEFRDVDFTSLDFSNVSFVGCYFNACIFNRSNLISSNLSQSSFHACDFASAKLIAANLTNAEFKKCNFKGVNFLTAILKDTSIINSDLTDLDLQSFNLIGITLDLCDLREQNLAGKDLSGASLKRADLRGANLDKAVFDGANLTDILIHGAQVKNTQFRSSTLSGVDFSAMDLSGINFQNALLRNCDFRDADLSNACLLNADITNARLCNLETLGWDIRGIRCERAYWDREASIKTDYKRNEFERTYAESLLIELKYDSRMTANEISTLPMVIEHLQACHWGTLLRLKAIKDSVGAAVVQLVVEEAGEYSLNELEISLKEEASRIQNAQLMLRGDRKIQQRFREATAAIKDEFWPHLLELAAENEIDQVRNFCVLFIDLKGFTQWHEGVVSEKLSLFRGLLKPILDRWKASYPNMEGDSLRATFRSSRNAVECACLVREVLMAAEFELRIGIDLGQVSIVHNQVTEQSDLEGNAVSMASRLESMADAGEIIVSEKVKHYAEQETSDFDFYPRKSRLTKGIGASKAGDWISIYHLQRKLTC